MEDFILREIDKIGQLIRGLLSKLHLSKPEEAEIVCNTTKVELAEMLHMDIDTLLAGDDFIGVLVGEYGFSHDNLESFAELLADLAAATEQTEEPTEKPTKGQTEKSTEEQTEERMRFAAAACAIYRYQDAHKAPASFNRYYILKELAKYNQ